MAAESLRLRSRRQHLVTTDNINLVPSVNVRGASLGPVVFVLYVYERAPEVSCPVLLVCFLAGGVLGVTAGTGARPTAYCSASPAPWASPRSRRWATGSLRCCCRRVGSTTWSSLLFARSVLAPAGHAAWTGLICATL